MPRLVVEQVIACRSNSDAVDPPLRNGRRNRHMEPKWLTRGVEVALCFPAPQLNLGWQERLPLSDWARGHATSDNLIKNTFLDMNEKRIAISKTNRRGSRVAFLPRVVANQVYTWLGEPSSEEFLPTPACLGALASYADTLVFCDGIVMSYPPNVPASVVPDWAYVGYRDADLDIDDCLFAYIPEATRLIVDQEVTDSYGSLYGDGYLGRHAAEYLAWNEYAKHEKVAFTGNWDHPRNIFHDGTFVLTTGKTLARALLERNRVRQSDIFGRVFSNVMDTLGEIQLPVVLATAVSRIDKPRHLIEELEQMHHKARRCRSRLARFERTVSNPTRRGSGRAIRRLANELKQEIETFAGVNLTFPGILEIVSGCAVADRQSLTKAAIECLRRVIRPELRLISSWTKDCALDTVGKLLQMFRSKGTESEWVAASKALQVHGTVAWYPRRKPTSL